MGKIIKRNITDEDGEVYGVVGNITRLGAYRAIRQDLDEYGIKDEVEFKPEDLRQVNFWETIKCPHDGQHDDYDWWGTPEKGEVVKPLGIGWIYQI